MTNYEGIKGKFVETVEKTGDDKIFEANQMHTPEELFMRRINRLHDAIEGHSNLEKDEKEKLHAKVQGILEKHLSHFQKQLKDIEGVQEKRRTKMYENAIHGAAELIEQLEGSVVGKLDEAASNYVISDKEFEEIMKNDFNVLGAAETSTKKP
jgi:hypothetical protein